MSHRQVFVVGSLRTNGPARQVFQAIQPPAPLESLADAVQAALAHWSDRFGKGQAPAHRVYRSDDGRTALVEVLAPDAEMTALALYKVAGMFYEAGRGGPAADVA